MISTRFYLDSRATAAGQAAPLRLVITKDSARAYLPLSVSLLKSQWDAKRQIVIAHPRKVALNNFIQSQKLNIDNLIFRMVEKGETKGLRANEIKDRLTALLYPAEKQAPSSTPNLCYRAFMNKKTGRTYDLYDCTLSRIFAFCPNFANLNFNDINVKWLEEFDAFLAKTAPSRNARNIHLRNLRAVFNYAIDEEYTQCYPFRKFKIRAVKTRKRALTIEQLRFLFSIELDGADAKYLDFLKLSFLLCGINVIDLCNAQKPVNGRVEYERAKTHRLYSIKIEPETEELINRYSGKERLVNFAENCKSYRSFYKHLAEFTSVMGEILGVKGFSSYWLRHSWATTARKIGISKDDIAQGLGHGGNTVTDIYIDEDAVLVDDANRKVIDWVLYGKL